MTAPSRVESAMIEEEVERRGKAVSTVMIGVVLFKYEMDY
jgi:hypothetical protein